MANYFTHFSAVLDVGTQDNARRALAIYQEFAARLRADEQVEIGFLVSITDAPESTEIWMRSGDTGESEHVVRFVLGCARDFRLVGRWGFQWANTCSGPRPDGFGGGAVAFDLRTSNPTMWTDTYSWLSRRLVPRSRRRGA